MLLQENILVCGLHKLTYNTKTYVMLWESTKTKDSILINEVKGITLMQLAENPDFRITWEVSLASYFMALCASEITEDILC